MAVRTARLLSTVVESVTVLGREPIPGYGFLPDSQDFAGPLQALSCFKPCAEKVFVAACDYPLFDPVIVTACCEKIDRHPSIHAVVPMIEEHGQPLCAIFRREAFSMIPTVLAEGRKSINAWLDSLWVEWIDEPELVAAGVPLQSLKNANSPSELEAILAE